MKRIIIDKGIFYTKIAYANGRELLDFNIHDNLNRSLVSSVYRGRVCRILPSLSAAFVDIGEEKNGYLPLSSEDNIKQGSEIIVQVEKDSIGEKGPRLSTEITIAGKYSILIPERQEVKISNKIRERAERDRLEALANRISEGATGLIVRTNAIDAQDETIEREVEGLKSKWESIKNESMLGIGSKCLYRPAEPIVEYLRDRFDNGCQEVVIRGEYDIEEAKSVLPKGCSDRVSIFTQTSDIFDFYKIKSQIKSLGRKKIWLESGAHIIIERTEALTVIDVNTGKNTKGFDSEQVILRTNEEAAVEVAKQIKLRDIGGIVVVDFIDMKSAKNRKRLLENLERLFLDEPGRAFVHGITKLGLVEITRKSGKKGMDMMLGAQCPICKGTGRVSSDYAILDSVEKEAARIKMHTNYKHLTLHASPDFYESMESSGFELLSKICEEHSVGITVLKDHCQKPGSAHVAAAHDNHPGQNPKCSCEFKEIYPLTKPY